MPTDALHIGRRLRRYVCVTGVLLAMPVAAALAGDVAEHADGAGIEWFGGDVDGAFELAGRENKPVFLYWGARWCPPCQQLKSSVFSRSDFIAKTRQFVAVYLDGDDSGAQKWGDTFHVAGYPTVVILRPDRHEVTRISGGMDLSLYADLLDIAQSDLRPIADVLATLQTSPATLTHAECQRLAYYAYELGDYSAEERSRIGTALAGAATSCPGLAAGERARLTVIATTLSIAPQSVAQIAAILADHDLGAAVADVLEGLGEDFFAAVLAQGPAVSERFQRDWERTMDQVATDPHRIDADQLVAIGKKLALVRQFEAPAHVPDAMITDARHHTSAALDRRTDPYVRAGVVNAASYIYEELDDATAEEALLRGELQTAKAPYYYMVDLGELEEKRGRKAEALVWYQRAYRESQGTATRFQWGNYYLSALLRLAPTDRSRIRATAAAVIGELDGPDRIHARTRVGLEKLDARLRQWNAGHRFDADVRSMRTRMQGICNKLPGADASQSSCRNFLAGAA